MQLSKCWVFFCISFYVSMMSDEDQEIKLERHDFLVLKTFTCRYGVSRTDLSLRPGEKLLFMYEKTDALHEKISVFIDRGTPGRTRLFAVTQQNGKNEVSLKLYAYTKEQFLSLFSDVRKQVVNPTHGKE